MDEVYNLYGIRADAIDDNVIRMDDGFSCPGDTANAI